MPHRGFVLIILYYKFNWLFAQIAHMLDVLL